MHSHSEKTQSELEELRSAISTYKKTIRQAETKKIKHYNKLYKEKVLEKVNLREEDKLVSAKENLSKEIL